MFVLERLNGVVVSVADCYPKSAGFDARRKKQICLEIPIVPVFALLVDRVKKIVFFSIYPTFQQQKLQKDQE
jgi:hypothetical protein